MIDQMMDREDGDAVVLVGKFYGEDTCLVHLRFYHVLVARMVSFTLGRDTNITFAQKTEALQSLDKWNATNLNFHKPDCVRSGCIIAWENIMALTEGFRVDENDHSHNARVDVWLA